MLFRSDAHRRHATYLSQGPDSVVLRSLDHTSYLEKSYSGKQASARITCLSWVVVPVPQRFLGEPRLDSSSIVQCAAIRNECIEESKTSDQLAVRHTLPAGRNRPLGHNSIATFTCTLLEGATIDQGLVISVRQERAHEKTREVESAPHTVSLQGMRSRYVGLVLTRNRGTRRAKDIVRLSFPIATCLIPRSMIFQQDRKSTRLNSSHSGESRMPSSA